MIEGVPADQESARASSPAAAEPRPLVAHVLYRLDVGGLENILVELINGMSGSRYRHMVICLADYTNFRHRLPDDVPVVALNKPPGLGLATFWQLWRLLRRWRPDLVHTSNLAALECQPVAALAGVPARVHAEHGWDMSDLDGSNRKLQLWRRLLSRAVHRHVTVSRHLAAYLVERAHIPEHRVRQIYNGVDTERYRPRESRRDGAKFVIGTVGRLQRVKDQLSLVRAFAGLRERVPEAFPRLQLLLVGDGPERGVIEEELTALGIREQADLTGNRDDVAALMRGMDVFALPSLAEGIPVTVLEAMATALPVVASRVGGVPELVSDGETGTLLPAADPELLADALATYVRDPAHARQQGDRARQRVCEAFSLEAMVNAYLALYDELLPANGGDERRG